MRTKLTYIFMLLLMLCATLQPLVLAEQTDLEADLAEVKSLSFEIDGLAAYSLAPGTLEIEMELKQAAPQGTVLTAALYKLYDRTLTQYDGENPSDIDSRGILDALENHRVQKAEIGEFSGSKATISIDVNQVDAVECGVKVFVWNQQEPMLSQIYTLLPPLHATDFTEVTPKTEIEKYEFATRNSTDENDPRHISHIGHMDSITAVEYEFMVLAEGDYTIYQCYSAAGRLKYTIDDMEPFEVQMIETGGWEIYGKIKLNDAPIRLGVGLHTMKIENTGGQNIAYFEFEQMAGSLPIIPIQIEARDFLEDESVLPNGKQASDIIDGGGYIKDLNDQTVLKYQFSIQTAGYYNMSANYAHEQGSPVLVKFTFDKGQSLEQEYVWSAERTSTWGTFVDSEMFGPIYLEAGDHTMEMTPSNGINLYRYKLIANTEPLPFNIIAKDRKTDVCNHQDGKIEERDGGVIGNFKGGDSMTYEFTVFEQGLYNVEINIQTADGIGMTHLKFNDGDPIYLSDDTITGWESWAYTRQIGPIQLNRGENTMVIAMDEQYDGNINIANYRFTPHTGPIPIVVESEDFKETTNENIETRREVKNSNGKIIANFSAGHTITYTFDVLYSGKYQLIMSYQTDETSVVMGYNINGSGQDFNLSRSSQGWGAFDKITVLQQAELEQGINTMTVTVGGNVNMDYFRFIPIVE